MLYLFKMKKGLIILGRNSKILAIVTRIEAEKLSLTGRSILQGAFALILIQTDLKLEVCTQHNAYVLAYFGSMHFFKYYLLFLNN